jgi:hypothetical protein
MGITQTKHKVYDELSPRKRVIRFMQDNSENYLDYPENQKPMIDDEDLSELVYYNTTYKNYCFWAGSASAGVIFLASLYNIQSKFKTIGLITLSLMPLPISMYYHYYNMGQFLDYCEAKYKTRGLYDEDLWEHHKQMSIDIHKIN